MPDLTIRPRPLPPTTSEDDSITISNEEMVDPESWKLQCLVSLFPKASRCYNATTFLLSTHPDPENADRPLCLAPNNSVTDYRADKMFYLRFFNFKVEALTCASKSSQKPRLTVLDTGEGPNLIRTSILLVDKIQSIDSTREIVNLASASSHVLDIRRLITLTGTVGSQTNRVPLVVLDKLGADAILGFLYINQAVEEIKCRRRGVLL